MPAKSLPACARPPRAFSGHLLCSRADSGSSLRARHHNSLSAAARTRRRLVVPRSAAEASRERLLDDVALAVGTWSWGNKLLFGYDERRDAELRACYQTLSATDHRLLFDTGDSYGTGRLEGRAEKLLGDFSRETPSGDRHVLATKLAVYPWRLTKASFVAAARASSARLRQPRIDLVQAHWSPSNYLPLQESALIDGLCDCHELGLALRLGLSNYGPLALRRVMRTLETRGLASCLATVQVQFSLLSRIPERTGLLETAAELGVRVLAYSPLALGLLSGKYDASSGGPPGLRGLVFGSQFRDVERLQSLLGAIAAERSLSPVVVAVNWCRARGTMPIVGARTVAHARDVISCLGEGAALSAGEVAELDAVSSRCRTVQQNPFAVP